MRPHDRFNKHIMEQQLASLAAQQQSQQNNAALQQMAMHQLTSQLRSNQLNPQSVAHFQALMKQMDSQRFLQQALQSQQNPTVANSPDERRRPSLISNFPMHSHSQQMNLGLIKQKSKAQYGLTAGLPLRSTPGNLSIPAALTRSAEIGTPPVPNRAQHLLNNIHAAQPAPHVRLDRAAKREQQEIRNRLNKATDDNKQLDAQVSTINKRRQQLLDTLKLKQEEMERERVEAAEAAAAQLRAQAHAEAIKSKIPLIDLIAMENRSHIEETRLPKRLLPTTNLTHDLAKITANYRRIGSAMVQKMTAEKLKTQKCQENYIASYDEKFASWSRRLEKYEKAPKKISRDQRNRELFEKIFPEIKREREERERNERHERNNSEEPPAKSKEEKAVERACHVPMYSGVKPRYSFKNTNTEMDEQELQNTNDNVNTFLSRWTPAERQTFNERIRFYGKNFHVLSHFYWEKTCCDMVRYYYSTKCENKYKLHFPKAKKKVSKSYKPPPMPDFREMFDHLLSTCSRKDSVAKVPCIICANDLQVFSEIPEMLPEKEKLRRKLVREQEYRKKMSICAKCYSTYKKCALRCPVGTCPGGKRRFKPSRTLPSEFTELPVEAQCLVVRNLRFHAGTPKVCNNCYKRIQTESISVRNDGLGMTPAVPQIRRHSDNKKQSRWTSDRIEVLFNVIAEVNATASFANGMDELNNDPKSSIVPCDWEAVAARCVFEDFNPTARQCRNAHAKIRDYWIIRSHRIVADNASRNFRRVYRQIKREAKREIQEGRLSLLKPPEIAQLNGTDVEMEVVDTSTTPVIEYKTENLRSRTTTPMTFEKHEAIKEEKKENEKNHLSVACHSVNPPTTQGLQSPAPSQLNAVPERPNRKSGLATVILESSSPADRSASPMQRNRAQTLQKHHHIQKQHQIQSRPASLPGPVDSTLLRPIKSEPIESMSVGANPLSNEKGRLHTQRAPTNNPQHLMYKKPGCDRSARSNGNGLPNEEPVYESLSDDTSSASSSDSEKPPNSQRSSEQQRSRWQPLLTIHDLPHHEQLRIPPCSNYFSMPPIESPSDPAASTYDDLSD
ncbi:hypothetical protein M3Y95_00002000 [Aphelenchoides besseyi]|nr:hypothetical protein M3Y95_00002000 [Aphelenchoides besseyi]